MSADHWTQTEEYERLARERDVHAWLAVCWINAGGDGREEARKAAAAQDAIGALRDAWEAEHEPEGPVVRGGKYECVCGWSIVWPEHDAEGAAEDIDDHERMHEESGI